jgi:hypothetical protein
MIMGWVRRREMEAALADAGARLDKAECARAATAEESHTLGERLADANRGRAYLQAELDVANAKLAEAQGRLARIIAAETPGMANVGKRMVRIAKGEG